MSQAYGTVDSALVTHPHFRELSETAKLLCLFLRVCGRANVLGAFQYSLVSIADDLNIPFEGASKGLLELSKHDFARYCEATRWVYIPRHLEKFPVLGVNRMKGAMRVLEEVPRTFAYMPDLLASLEEHHSYGNEKNKGLIEDTEGAWKGLRSRLEAPSNSTTTTTPPTTTTDLGLTPYVPEDRSDPVSEVFDHWREVMRHPKAALDDKRRKTIRIALKGYSVDDLKKAIDGCSRTPHNMGQNDQHQRYDDLGLILRDAAHIDRFVRNADRPVLVGVGDDDPFAGAL